MVNDFVKETSASVIEFKDIGVVFVDASVKRVRKIEMIKEKEKKRG